MVDVGQRTKERQPAMELGKGHLAKSRVVGIGPDGRELFLLRFYAIPGKKSVADGLNQCGQCHRLRKAVFEPKGASFVAHTGFNISSAVDPFRLAARAARHNLKQTARIHGRYHALECDAEYFGSGFVVPHGWQLVAQVDHAACLSFEKGHVIER